MEPPKLLSQSTQQQHELTKYAHDTYAVCDYERRPQVTQSCWFHCECMWRFCIGKSVRLLILMLLYNDTGLARGSGAQRMWSMLRCITMMRYRLLCMQLWATSRGL